MVTGSLSILSHPQLIGVIGNTVPSFLQTPRDWCTRSLPISKLTKSEDQDLTLRARTALHSIPNARQLYH